MAPVKAPNILKPKQKLAHSGPDRLIDANSFQDGFVFNSEFSKFSLGFTLTF